MKPTPATQRDFRRSRHDFIAPRSAARTPNVECAFQPLRRFFPGGGDPFRKRRLAAQLRAFRAVSADFQLDEGRRNYWWEGAFFAVIVAITTWPLAQAAAEVYSILRW